MKTNITFRLTSDTEIPRHLCNEAAELFLSHLKKHYVEQLLRDDSCGQEFSGLENEKKSVQMEILHSLKVYGKSCPVYYKNDKGRRNVAKRSQTQRKNTL